MCFCGKFAKFLRTTSVASFETKHMLQVPIYYILEEEISTGSNTYIAKTKREKQIVFVVERRM